MCIFFLISTSLNIFWELPKFQDHFKGVQVHKLNNKYIVATVTSEREFF